MQKVNNKDIDFQPITEGYSYSANGGSSKNSNSQNKKYGVYLLVGIILLITILLAAFFYLNNSGVNFLSQKPLNLQEKNSPTDNPKFKNYTKLENQATDAQISNYIALIKAKNIPLDDLKYPDEIYGIFSGFDNNYIQIITYSGIRNLSYTKDLYILEQGKAEKSTTSSGVSIGFSRVDNNSFFNQNMFGKTLHLKITPTTPEAILQIYLTE